MMDDSWQLRIANEIIKVKAGMLLASIAVIAVATSLKSIQWLREK